jgi:hypothetical protein
MHARSYGLVLHSKILLIAAADVQCCSFENRVEPASYVVPSRIGSNSHPMPWSMHLTASVGPSVRCDAFHVAIKRRATRQSNVCTPASLHLAIMGIRHSVGDNIG